MKEYKTIPADYSCELEIKKSRFICHLKRVTTEEEAREFITTIKKEHYKANHNCSAFILGEEMNVKRSSDDGEPSGTAGVPMLTVLEKQEVTNLVAVVTRYFGGVKLGAGGLIRAYAGAVAQALEEAGVVCVKEQQGIHLALSYAQYQDFLSWRAEKGYDEYDTAFLEAVTTTIYVDKEETTAVLADLDNFFLGKIHAQQGNLRIVEVPIV